MRLRALLIAVAFVCAPAAALAHPHVWVDAAAEIVFDDKGRIAAIRHHWRFDEEFSAYALQGLDTDRDGKYSPQELAPLAKENVESLKDFDFFTSLSVGDYQAGFAAPKDYHLELMDGRLLLHFTLPLASPLLTRGTAMLEVGDPEYYVAFSLPSIEAVRLVDAPAACRLAVHPGEEPDAVIAAQLAEIGADQRELPPEMQSLTAGTENSAEVNCGGPPRRRRTRATPSPPMAGSGAAPGDLTALPAAPTRRRRGDRAGDASAASGDCRRRPRRGRRAAAAAAPPPPRSPGLMRRWTAWIGALQTQFNRDLTAALKALNARRRLLVARRRLVPLRHRARRRAGPRQGGDLLLSRRQRGARSGAASSIAFIAAFVQAVVAVGIIGLMAVVLNMTSMAIDSTAKVFEAGSFALVAALGVYLLARKGRAAWAVLQAATRMRASSPSSP